MIHQMRIGTDVFFTENSGLCGGALVLSAYFHSLTQACNAWFEFSTTWLKNFGLLEYFRFGLTLKNLDYLLGFSDYRTFIAQGVVTGV